MEHVRKAHAYDLLTKIDMEAENAIKDRFAVLDPIDGHYSFRERQPFSHHYDRFDRR